MSRAYKARKKAIRDEKRRIGPKGLFRGQIPEMDFKRLQESWSEECAIKEAMNRLKEQEVPGPYYVAGRAK